MSTGDEEEEDGSRDGDGVRGGVHEVEVKEIE